MAVASKRRNPLLADFFHRLKLMERRGSGMNKIIGEYKRFEKLENYHAPEFNSNASEFHATLWNLNYDMDVIKDDPRVVKEAENVVKAKTNVTKEFVKAYSGDIRSLFWLLSLPSLPYQRFNVITFNVFKITCTATTAHGNINSSKKRVIQTESKLA